MTPSAVRLEQLASTPLAVVRRLASASELATVVPQGCGLVWSFVRARNLQAGRNVAIYWDAGIRLEVGVELAAPFSEEGEIVRSATPAGLAASVIHFGPYAGLGAAHEAIRQWCTDHHHRLAGPNWEVYGHWQSDWNVDSSRIRTDVFYQIAPGQARGWTHGPAEVAEIVPGVELWKEGSNVVSLTSALQPNECS